MRYPLYFILLVLYSCSDQQEDLVMETDKAKQLITLLPFVGTDKTMIREIQSRLEERLHASVVLLGEKPLPAMAFYKPRQRYVADSLLVFLKQCNEGRTGKIIGVTHKDISTTQKPHFN